MAAILPAFRRNQNWADGVRAAYGAFFDFLASHPALARVVLVEVYAAGPAALERREEALRPLEVLLGEGRARAPQVPRIVVEAIAGGTYALAHRRIRDSGPENLPGLAPVCTYLALAPFLGAEEACAVANGDGRAPSSAELDLIGEEMDKALEAGAFDARPDRHLSRVPVLVDEQGWRKLMDIHRQAFLASLEVQSECAERLKDTDKPAIEGHSMQMLFEVPAKDP